MDRFDFFLEIKVLLVETRPFALRQHAVRDVHEERTTGLDDAVLVAAGLHPHIDPQGATVLAAEFHFPSGDGLAGQVLAVHFHAPTFPGRGIRHEGVDHRAHQLFHRKTEQLGQAAVGADDPPVGADDQVGIGRVLKQIAIAGLTGPELLFGPHPLQFGRGAGGEDAKNEATPRFRRHGPLVENRQVPQDLALAVQKRYGHVAVDAALDQGSCPREEFRNPRRVMDQPTAHDFGTRRPGEVILEVAPDPVALPEGKRADVRRSLGEFGDDRVGNVDGYR
jgi:hypothetical protein